MHGLLGLFTRREMDKGKVTHHLQFLNVTIGHSIENVLQVLFGCGKREIADI